MKFCLKFIPFFLLSSSLHLLSDDAALQDFDDDAFLSAKVAGEGEAISNLTGWSLFRSKGEEDRYIINFYNVSMVEYIRFVGKISKLNFQFDEPDLNFPVTIVSEDPLTVQNILSALIQTLRSRGLSLLEQDNYLMVTKSKEITQIPTLVLPGKQTKQQEKAPIVTRVFRIQNANLNSVAAILRPMMSQAAMLDISVETRQLIVTDITTNVDKIATLLQSLDSPHSPLEIEVYKTRHVPTTTLILLTDQIVRPFSEGNPLIFVPQAETNSIFIVSTPHLIERAIEVMEDLDIAPKKITGASIGDRVFLYRLTNKSADELLEALENIATQLQGSGSQSIKLISALENVKWIEDSNSLLFLTDLETQTKIEEILKTLDTFSDARNYYIYKIEKAEEDVLQTSLNELVKSLKKNPSERELVEAIQSLRYIKETNSFIFTGSDEALKKIKELLPNLDVAASADSSSNHYLLYTPQYLSGKELLSALEDLEDNLGSSGLKDDSLLKAIHSMKWVPSTNTLLFTGTPPALEHVQSMIKLIDIPAGAPTKIFLYQPQFISNDQIETALDELADKLDHKNLSDRNLATAIDSMTWIPESQNFLFKSDPASIEKLQGFLKDIDNPKEAESIASAYFLFNLKYARGEDILLHLEKIAKSLPEHDPAQKAIVEVIDKITLLKETNSLLLTGPQKAVDSVKTLISQFDVVGATPPSHEKTAFFIYKPLYLSLTDLEAGLHATADDLRKSGLIDPSLLESIDTMRIVDATHSLIFTGSKESLEKAKEIISTIDVKGAQVTAETLGEFSGHTFFIYKVRYVTTQELLRLLSSVVLNLEKEGKEKNQQLIKSIKSAKEIPETTSLLFTGPAPVLEKINDLLKQLDTPTGLGEKKEVEARAVGTYVVYKPVNVSGPELIELMRDFHQNLAQSGVNEPDVFETIDNLKYISRTGYILVSGDQVSVEKVQELLKKFDVPGQGTGVTSLTQMETSFLIYKLHYHLGNELQMTLKAIAQDLTRSDPQAKQNLMNAINSIQWIKITNSLLATGTPEILTQLKELIQNLDIPLRQVFIEVLIIETTLSNNQQFGLQWGGKVQYLNRFAGGTSNFPSPNPAGTASRALSEPLSRVNATNTPLASDIVLPSQNGGGFDLGVIGDIILHKGKTFLSLASLVNALQQDSDTVVVMNPKIVAQDNQQATIFVGQNIPFTGSQVSTIQGGGSQVQSNIEYRDVGVNLSITPILGMNDIITLDIINEITNQVENTTSSGASLQGLQTSRTALNARVHVPNKHFVALSGMLQDTKTHFRSAIPCLGGLPIIGAFFSENDRLNSRNNVIFFIRPVIIDSVEEYRKITENQEDLYKEVGVKQIVKEEIDEAIDWIRSQED